jgi:hypothetical protein
MPMHLVFIAMLLTTVTELAIMHDNLLTDGALSSGHPLAGIGGNPGHP